MLSNAAAYRTTDVTTASPSQRRLMLLEGALTAAHSLRDAHAAGDFEAIAEQGSHCRSILIALMTELDASSDRRLADQLSSLHAWIWQQVASASTADDLDDPITILTQQRDAWREAVDLLRTAGTGASEPLGPVDVAG
ncbi:MAG: flagellar export chaperone FliS [Planctomycetota bacterium]|nr:flagellar export chaperone FliS [Planctomycetota bacterium]